MIPTGTLLRRFSTKLSREDKSYSTPKRTSKPIPTPSRKMIVKPWPKPMSRIQDSSWILPTEKMLEFWVEKL